jgi:PAS domain S-box-containing protein
LVHIQTINDSNEDEKFLQEEEDKYRRFFEDDLTGDFIATPEGAVLECNPSFVEIYCFENREKALKSNISQFNPTDWINTVAQLKIDRKIKGHQSSHIRHDGKVIQVIANLVGIFNDSDELIQVKGYVFDDTDRKKAEEELNRSKSQIKEILDSIQDGFIALTHHWHFIYVNKCAAEYFGVEYDDLIGQNLWQQFPELIGTIYEITFRRAVETEEIQHFQSKGMPNSDHMFDFSVYPLANGISVYFRDIGERKKEK